MFRKHRKLAFRSLARAAIAGVFLAFGAFGAQGDTTLFSANFDASTAEKPTTLANLNLGTPVGVWSGDLDGRPGGIETDTAGINKALLADQNLTVSGFSFDANLSGAAALADGVKVSFKLAPRRTGAGKSAEIAGVDGSGNISFRMRMRVEAGATQCFDWYDGVSWIATGTATTEVSYVAELPAANDFANFASIELNLSASNYTLTYTPGANLSSTVSGYTTAPLTYINSPTQITRVNFSGVDKTGLWLDDVSATTGGSAGVGDWGSY